MAIDLMEGFDGCSLASDLNKRGVTGADITIGTGPSLNEFAGRSMVITGVASATVHAFQMPINNSDGFAFAVKVKFDLPATYLWVGTQPMVCNYQLQQVNGWWLSLWTAGAPGNSDTGTRRLSKQRGFGFAKAEQGTTDQLPTLFTTNTITNTSIRYKIAYDPITDDYVIVNGSLLDGVIAYGNGLAYRNVGLTGAQTAIPLHPGNPVLVDAKHVPGFGMAFAGMHLWVRKDGTVSPTDFTMVHTQVQNAIGLESVDQHIVTVTANGLVTTDKNTLEFKRHNTINRFIDPQVSTSIVVTTPYQGSNFKLDMRARSLEVVKDGALTLSATGVLPATGGSALLSASDDGQIIVAALAGLATGANVTRVRLSENQGATFATADAQHLTASTLIGVAVAQDGSKFATVLSDGSITETIIATGTTSAKRPPSGAMTFNPIAYGDNGNVMYACRADSPGSGYYVEKFAAGSWADTTLGDGIATHAPMSVACSADGLMVASVALVTDGTKRILYSTDGGVTSQNITLTSTEILYNLSVSPDGSTIAVTGMDNVYWLRSGNLVVQELPPGWRGVPKQPTGNLNAAGTVLTMSSASSYSLELNLTDQPNVLTPSQTTITSSANNNGQLVIGRSDGSVAIVNVSGAAPTVVNAELGVDPVYVASANDLLAAYIPVTGKFFRLNADLTVIAEIQMHTLVLTGYSHLYSPLRSTEGGVLLDFNLLQDTKFSTDGLYWDSIPAQRVSQISQLAIGDSSKLLEWAINSSQTSVGARLIPIANNGTLTPIPINSDNVYTLEGALTRVQDKINTYKATFYLDGEYNAESEFVSALTSNWAAVATNIDGSITYAVHYGGSLYRRIGNTRNWEFVAILPVGTYSSLDISDDGAVIAVALNNAPLLVSTDHGVTFKATSATVGSFQQVTVSASGQKILLVALAGTAAATPLQLSIDFGTTFSIISPAAARMCASMNKSGTHIIKASGTANPTISTDDGANWVDMANTVASAVTNSLAISDDGLTVAIILRDVSNLYVWVTSDGGATPFVRLTAQVQNSAAKLDRLGEVLAVNPPAATAATTVNIFTKSTDWSRGLAYKAWIASFNINQANFALSGDGLHLYVLGGAAFSVATAQTVIELKAPFLTVSDLVANHSPNTVLQYPQIQLGRAGAQYYDDLVYSTFASPNAGMVGPSEVLLEVQDTDVSTDWRAVPEGSVNAIVATAQPSSATASEYVESVNIGDTDIYMSSNQNQIPAGYKVAAVAVEAEFSRMFPNTPQVQIGLQSMIEAEMSDIVPVTSAIGSSTNVKKIFDADPDGVGWTPTSAGRASTIIKKVG